MNNFHGTVSDPRENIIATLGNGYSQSFISTGIIAKNSFLLTDKRVYFNGRVYTGLGLKANYYGQEIVDLKDITGTGFQKVNPIIYILMGILNFILSIVFFAISSNYNMRTTGVVLGIVFLVISLVCILLYVIGRKTVFYIKYAGGIIMLDLRFISYNEAIEFNRTLRICKDNITNYVQPATPYRPG